MFDFIKKLIGWNIDDVHFTSYPMARLVFNMNIQSNPNVSHICTFCFKTVDKYIPKI